jgi:hypothetical protein
MSVFNLRSSVPAVMAIALLGLATGCQDSDIVGTGAPELVLSEASVTVGGQSIDGEVLYPSENDGVFRFEARLVDQGGRPAYGHRVRVAYNLPGMGMMHRTGTFMLHDDGMHGDPVAHDGIYCYEDESHQYGCHGPHAGPGEYHYEFCGIDDNGHESNRIGVTAVVSQ